MPIRKESSVSDIGCALLSGNYIYPSAVIFGVLAAFDFWNKCVVDMVYYLLGISPASEY
jgi:hypothetical protein